MNWMKTGPRGMAQAPGAAVQPRVAPWGFPELFVIGQTALPALLYLPGTQAFRLPLRFSAFGISLAAFVWWQVQSSDRPSPHRAQPWVMAVVGLLAVMLSSPYTGSLVGGLAHMMVYVAVVALPAWLRRPRNGCCHAPRARGRRAKRRHPKSRGSAAASRGRSTRQS